MVFVGTNPSVAIGVPDSGLFARGIICRSLSSQLQSKLRLLFKPLLTLHINETTGANSISANTTFGVWLMFFCEWVERREIGKHLSISLARVCFGLFSVLQPCFFSSSLVSRGAQVCPRCHSYEDEGLISGVFFSQGLELTNIRAGDEAQDSLRDTETPSRL